MDEVQVAVSIRGVGFFVAGGVMRDWGHIILMKGIIGGPRDEAEEKNPCCAGGILRGSHGRKRDGFLGAKKQAAEYYPARIVALNGSILPGGNPSAILDARTPKATNIYY